MRRGRKKERKRKKNLPLSEMVLFSLLSKRDKKRSRKNFACFSQPQTINFNVQKRTEKQTTQNHNESSANTVGKHRKS
jgi:hypothetical protein